jgi:hypothetical protein
MPLAQKPGGLLRLMVRTGLPTQALGSPRAVVEAAGKGGSRGEASAVSAVERDMMEARPALSFHPGLSRLAGDRHGNQDSRPEQMEIQEPQVPS